MAAAAAAANVSGPPRNMHNVQTHEMSIPNELIGCIIGRGGQKISEIRYLDFFSSEGKYQYLFI